MKKSKKQDMFTVERKGYSQREVEDYILKEIEKNEIIHSEQRARIEELLEEIDGLKKVVDDYKAKEDKIAEALIVASEKADKMTADIKLRYAMELDRLNMFRAKWTGAYNELKERYGLTEMRSIWKVLPYPPSLKLKGFCNVISLCQRVENSPHKKKLSVLKQSDCHLFQMALKT